MCASLRVIVPISLENGTAIGPKNACSYADIVAEEVDKQVLASQIVYPELKGWFRFRDDNLYFGEGRLSDFRYFSKGLISLTKVNGVDGLEVMLKFNRAHYPC